MNIIIIFFLIINLFNNAYSGYSPENKTPKCRPGIIIKKPRKNYPQKYNQYSKKDKEKIFELMSENPQSSFKEIAKKAEIKYSVVVSWIKKNPDLKSTKRLIKTKPSNRSYIKHSKETINTVLTLANEVEYNDEIVKALKKQNISLNQNQVKYIKYISKSKKKYSLSNTPNSNRQSESRKNSLSKTESDKSESEILSPKKNLFPEPLNLSLPNNSLNLLIFDHKNFPKGNNINEPEFKFI